VAIGNQVGTSLIGGNNNVLIGRSAGQSMINGIRNITLGELSGSAITDGVNNITLGERSGANISTGSSNITIGNRAGTNIYTEDNNIMIGNYTRITGGVTGSVVIGSNASSPYTEATVSNALFVKDSLSGFTGTVPADILVYSEGNGTTGQIGPLRPDGATDGDVLTYSATNGVGWAAAGGGGGGGGYGYIFGTSTGTAGSKFGSSGTGFSSSNTTITVPIGVHQITMYARVLHNNAFNDMNFTMQAFFNGANTNPTTSADFIAGCGGYNNGVSGHEKTPSATTILDAISSTNITVNVSGTNTFMYQWQICVTRIA